MDAETVVRCMYGCSGANFGGQARRALLWLRTGPPQVDGGIGPLRLVGP